MDISIILDPNSPIAQQTARDIRALITAQRSQIFGCSQHMRQSEWGSHFLLGVGERSSPAWAT